MANRKQRRRREKEKRHDYDLVEIDAEGNETVLTASELKDADDKPSSKNGKAVAGSGKAKGSGRGGRTPQPPSWSKVARRGLIFAPIFLITVLLLGRGKITWEAGVVNTALLLTVFIPLSYAMDAFVYRSALRKSGKTGVR